MLNWSLGTKKKKSYLPTKPLELFKWKPLVLVASEHDRNRKRLLNMYVCVLTFEDTWDV